jgi:hypothetical protein
MSVKHGFLFDHSPESQANAPSSGDGSASPAVVWPDNGQVNEAYQSPTVAPRMDTSGGLDSALSRDRDPTAAYRAACAAASGVKPGGSAGMALTTGEGFDTTGSISSDSAQQAAGYGIAGRTSW